MQCTELQDHRTAAQSLGIHHVFRHNVQPLRLVVTSSFLPYIHSYSLFPWLYVTFYPNSLQTFLFREGKHVYEIAYVRVNKSTDFRKNCQKYCAVLVLQNLAFLDFHVFPRRKNQNNFSYQERPTYLGPGTSPRILLTVRNRNGQLKLKGEPSPLYSYPSFPSTSQLSLSHLPPSLIIPIR